MATEEFKAITITGGAIADLGMKKRRGRTRKSGGADIDDTPPPPPPSTITKVVPSPAPPVPSPAPSVPPAPTVGGAPNLFRTSNQIGPSLTFEQNQSQQGGTKHIKVELKKKHLSKKVTLNPKKQDVPPVKQPAHTKKSRKFVLGISSMHKRVTRAKKIQHKLDKMPLEELRKQLIASKLIKATSKAPEAILRQIAKDSQLVGKKIL